MSVAAIPASIAERGADQPAAVATLAAALASGPGHAYIFIGPPGSGKAALARAFCAELLSLGEDDERRAAEARRRALADPSPHPDLVWLKPVGTAHLVEEVRERVIAAVSYRPFEANRRVFVIEAADALAPEAQNALLKTLEEPPAYAHLILLSAEPAALLATVRSRCSEVQFIALPPAVIERLLETVSPGTGPEQRAALALLCAGDYNRAKMLDSPQGSKLRSAAESCARGARAGRLGDRPWQVILAVAEEAGKLAAEAVVAAAGLRAEEAGERKQATRIKREGDDAAKRADRLARTESVDLGLSLAATWFADLSAHSEGAKSLIRNLDRGAELAADAEGMTQFESRRAAELIMQTRRRLQVNVNEELALEATFQRCAAVFAGGI